MNSSLNIHSSHLIDPVVPLEAWVYQGLLHFWETALPIEHGVYQLLKTRCCGLLKKQLLPAWRASWPWEDTTSSDFHLFQFIHGLNLSPASGFILALTGMVETSHLVSLVLSELQAPNRNSRLTVHLASALAHELFFSEQDVKFLNGDSLGRDYLGRDSLTSIREPLGPVALASHILITNQFITLHGDEPLPLQRLHMNPWVWSLLLSHSVHLRHSVHWPGLVFFPKKETATQKVSSSCRTELSLLADLLMSSKEHSRGVVVRGHPYSGRGLCAQVLAEQLGLQAVSIPLDVWLSQTVLKNICAYAKWLPVLRLNESPTQTLGLDQCSSPLVIIASFELTLPDANMLDFCVPTPNVGERKELWLQEFNLQALSNELAQCARLSAHAIHNIASGAKQLAQRANQCVDFSLVAKVRARIGAEKLRLLAQPVERKVTEDALVTSSLVKEGLALLRQRACQRESLWTGLGTTLSVTPNPGVRALFVGESGTGKTLAASYVSTCLGAPLYRVDLSAVMNKYIGESEKNLSQLLDHAAATDVVLLFDEADALFGSRGDGQETGERFANMLTNFLLTRIETHPGIVILTTNSRERIDNAFMRRLDLIIEFPLPSYQERLELWHSHLGDRGPGSEVYGHLANYCDLAGGQLRNVVLTAAAVANNEPIECEHLLVGLRSEYRKQGREMPRKLEGLANTSLFVNTSSEIKPSANLSSRNRPSHA